MHPPGILHPQEVRTVNQAQTTSRLSGRQKAILEHARIHGEVEVDPLAESFRVTPQTIRRDLNHLCNQRLLQRVHGGALVHDGVENLGYAARLQIAAEEKNSIGERAAELIANDSSLFINIGTTTESVAEHLQNHKGLLVITNNLNVVNTLRTSESVDVMTAGGTVRREDGGIVGETTAEFFAQFKVDYAVIGASAIEADGAILDFDVREVRVAQAIIRNARSVILVADSTKFQRECPVRIGSIEEIDYFITDAIPSPDFMKICQSHDVRVEVTNSESP
jgi:DeoR family glycerol-3-phosphate regulon repressor